jgi:hypothetical protein
VGEGKKQQQYLIISERFVWVRGISTPTTSSHKEKKKKKKKKKKHILPHEPEPLLEPPATPVNAPANPPFDHAADEPDGFREHEMRARAGEREIESQQ